MRCFHCQKKGHFIRNCPKLRKGHKGKFHADVVEEKETYRKKSGEASSEQETRKEYYLVSALTDSLKDSV